MPTYYPPVNFKSYTLDTSAHPTGLSAVITTITVNEAIAGLPSNGYLTLDRAGGAGVYEIVKWTSYDSGTKTFTVTRGSDDTSGVTHTTSVTIVVGVVAGYINDLKTYVDSSFAAPPAIGATTPAAGSFTTLSATGAVTLSGTLATLDVDNLTLSPASGVPLTITAPASTNAVTINVAEDDTTEFFKIYNSTGAYNAMVYVDKTLKIRFGTGAGTFLALTNTSDGAQLGTDFGTTSIPYIKMLSLDGTAYYLYVRNNGDWATHTSVPTGNTDGSVVGTQT